MNYLETLAYIESLSPTLERPSLTRIKAFIADGHKSDLSFPVFHVGGTNGKGSTVAILDSLLRNLGLKAGRFTGPHLLRWNERFHVNGTAIDDATFARLATELRTQSESFGKLHPQLGPLTWFEFLTVMAFTHFREQKVDVAVLEVGLGGRFDATNVVENVLATAITSIDLDHTQILGDTIAQIAFEKAGIIKAGRPIVTACHGEAFDVIRKQANDQNAPLFHCRLPADVTRVESEETPLRDPLWLSMREEFLRHAGNMALHGKHQQMNALVALFSLYLASLTDKQRFLPLICNTDLSFIGRSLSSVYWAGRFQYIQDQALVLDGAHNPAGALALRQALDERFRGRRLRFVVSCFENKNVSGMLEALVTERDVVYVSEPATRRATYSKDELVRLCGQLGAAAHSYPSIVEALKAALSEREKDDLVVATGSFATVRETMTHLGWRCVEDGIAEWVKISGES